MRVNADHTATATDEETAAAIRRAARGGPVADREDAARRLAEAGRTGELRVERVTITPAEARERVLKMAGDAEARRAIAAQAGEAEDAAPDWSEFRGDLFYSQRMAADYCRNALDHLTPDSAQKVCATLAAWYEAQR